MQPTGLSSESPNKHELRAASRGGGQGSTDNIYELHGVHGRCISSVDWEPGDEGASGHACPLAYCLHGLDGEYG